MSNGRQMAGADVKRILVTRLVGNTYYARILLGLPGDSHHALCMLKTTCPAVASIHRLGSGWVQLRV